MVALPADFMSMRSVYIDTCPRVPLEYMTPSQMSEKWGCEIGTPENYTIIGSDISFGPSPDKQYSVVLIYQKELAALSEENPSNWLLDEHPDIYLFGALAHAEFYGWNDARLPLIKGQMDEWIEQLNMLGNEKRYGGGPIAPSGPTSIRGVRS